MEKLTKTGEMRALTEEKIWAEVNDGGEKNKKPYKSVISLTTHPGGNRSGTGFVARI